jgi:hypothetical protein
MKALSRLRWTALALIAIAVVAAIRLFGASETVHRDGLTYAGPTLSRTLESGNDEPGTRVLVRFDDVEGIPCRAFLGSDVSGIACEERGGWHLRMIRDGVDLGDPAAVTASERALRASAAGMKRQ